MPFTSPAPVPLSVHVLSAFGPVRVSVRDPPTSAVNPATVTPATVTRPSAPTTQSFATSAPATDPPAAGPVTTSTDANRTDWPAPHAAAFVVPNWTATGPKTADRSRAS